MPWLELCNSALHCQALAKTCTAMHWFGFLAYFLRIRIKWKLTRVSFKTLLQITNHFKFSHQDTRCYIKRIAINDFETQWARKLWHSSRAIATGLFLREKLRSLLPFRPVAQLARVTSGFGCMNRWIACYNESPSPIQPMFYDVRMELSCDFSPNTHHCWIKYTWF